MMHKSAFIDEVEISVCGGDGGSGIVSFLRERARPLGGPNGGDGGNGGNVIMQATVDVNTLSEFIYRRQIKAIKGGNGQSKKCHGANGEDVLLKVPLGTQIFDAETGFLHADLEQAEQTTILAQGGRGGHGNAYFKSSVNRAPRRSTKGEKCFPRKIRLELSVLADIGLLGMTNAGKSTLLTSLSSAHPKIGDYPFTTLEPHLGVVIDEKTRQSLVVADIPGLIAGAASGVGLGNRFLRHLMRAKLLCQMVDVSSNTIIEDCQVIENELRQAKGHSSLLSKQRWLVLNKIDQIEFDHEQLKRKIKKHFPQFEKIFLLSALTGAGVAMLKDSLLEYSAQAAS